MNLGIYIPSLSNHQELQSISNAMNNAISNKIVNDASLFYDSVSYNPFQFKCGLFNSTDLWNFNGKLITTALSTTLSALKIINNIDLYYYYGFEERISPLSLLYLLNNSGIKFISNNETTSNDLYRKTGHKSLLTSDSFEEIIQKIR